MRSPRRKAPSVPASLQRSASASNRRFSLPENWRRLAIATTSGSRRAAASEAVSPVALRAPSATASEEEPNDPFIEDFSNEVMCMSYLYSKLPETGVSPHIGTGGSEPPAKRQNMTFGLPLNMRANCVRTLAAWCLGRGCDHFWVVDVSAYPDYLPAPSFGPNRLRSLFASATTLSQCSSCFGEATSALPRVKLRSLQAIARWRRSRCITTKAIRRASIWRDNWSSSDRPMRCRAPSQ